MRFIFNFLLISLFFISCVDSQASTDNLKNKNDLGKTRKFTFNYNVDLDYSNDKVEVWVPIPQTNPVQTISNEKLDSGPLYCELITEIEHNNKYYYCYADNLADDISLSFSCDVERKEHGRVTYHNLYANRYDKGTDNIMIPEGGLFDDIIRKHKLIKTDMRSVYNYILNEMYYGKPKSENDVYYSNLPETGKFGRTEVNRDKVVSLFKDAEASDGNYTFGHGNSNYACDIGVGNCTDYHSYFMSISRSMDVPARFHMGFSIPEGREGQVKGYHCWSDYYVEQEGWYPVDISEADKDSEKVDYYFGKVDENRVEFTVGRDLNLKNYDGYLNFFIYPIVKGTTYSKSFNYKNI